MKKEILNMTIIKRSFSIFLTLKIMQQLSILRWFLTFIELNKTFTSQATHVMLFMCKTFLLKFIYHT